MSETITVRGEGLTVDLILWRKYGLKGRALLEAAYLLNPGLADLGAILPLGAKFQLPALPAQTVQPVQPISLFRRNAS